MTKIMDMRRYIMAVLGLCASLGAMAQNEKMSDYKAFRQQMLADYQGYRGKILDDYAKFLDTVWDDYESFKGKPAYEAPKPQTVPQATPTDATPAATIPTPERPAQPAAPAVPAKPATPTVPAKPAAPTQKNLSFGFYSLKVQAPALELPALNGDDSHAVSALWQQLQNQDVYGRVSSALEQYRLGCNLNDWLSYELVHAYAVALYPGNDNAGTILTHYLLAHMGYNVRLGRTGAGRLLLLMPFRQMVYVRPYLNIDGEQYTIFMYENGRDVSRNITTLSTCRLPADADLGQAFNLVLDRPIMPARGEKQYELSDGVITLRGTVPELPVALAEGFVQTDIPVYDQSCLSASFRNDLLAQVREQLQGLTEKEAVSRLMHFVQFAFKYATDNEQFGYEKPFFVEDNFYYPYNDCEDRAVLFAFFVRNLLGLDVHLLHYPEHMATAVCFTDQTLQGDGYMYRGRRYLICDPTYIGAGIGRCMPRYEKVTPKIEF